MDILQIDKTNIKSIGEFIKAYKNGCEDLVSIFNGTLSRQDVSKEWTKFIIKNDAVIKSIVIDCQKGIVTDITFFGLLDITFADLVALFGESVERFERYDDTFEFSFRRDASNAEYSIKCFVLYDDKQKANWQNENLGNISIHLG